MIYAVKYKKIGSWFWKKIKVKGDAVLPEMKNIRLFILPDETRLEVCMDGMEFEFSKDRQLSILKKMEAESGRKIPTHD